MNKAIGITRSVDALGRIVIPKEMRRTLSINVGDPVDICLNSNREIVVRKHNDATYAEMVQFVLDEIEKNGDAEAQKGFVLALQSAKERIQE